MTEVFVSYKREDLTRVEPLVLGLRRSGLQVTWDQDIAAGQFWRQEIRNRLEAARCIVVVWSHTSVSDRGDFVHDEANRAKARGVLLPVRIDAIHEPVGFGEIKSFDLVGWQGRTRDRRFRNLVATIQAKVAGRPLTSSVLPIRKLRLAAMGSTLGILATILAFLANIFTIQQPLCKVPGIRAVCARYSLGGLPTKADIALWSGRRPGDCEGLRFYLERFPRGAYADEAARRLLAATTVKEESWTPPDGIREPIRVRVTENPLPSREAAHADALARGANDGACDGFKTGEYRLLGTSVEVKDPGWDCRKRGSGWVCGFDGFLVCRVQARQVIQKKICR